MGLLGLSLCALHETDGQMWGEKKGKNTPEAFACGAFETTGKRLQPPSIDIAGVGYMPGPGLATNCQINEVRLSGKLSETKAEANSEAMAIAVTRTAGSRECWMESQPGVYSLT